MWTSHVWSSTPIGLNWLGNRLNASIIKWNLPGLYTILKSYSENNKSHLANLKLIEVDLILVDLFHEPL